MESLSQMDIVGDAQAKHIALVLPGCGGDCCGVAYGREKVFASPFLDFERGSGSCSPAMLALRSWLGEGQGEHKIVNILGNNHFPERGPHL